MGSDGKLRFAFTFGRIGCQDVPHLANERLLDLSVQMHLGLFNEDHLAKRTVLLRWAIRIIMGTELNDAAQ